MAKKDRYPPRYKPYYLWGVGWFEDTRYIDKAKGKLGSGCGLLLILILGYSLLSLTLSAFGVH